MKRIKYHNPVSLLLLLLSLNIILGTSSRLIYFFMSKETVAGSSLILSLGRGLFFDFVVALYLFAPIALVGIFPEKIWRTWSLRKISFGYFYFVSAVLAFGALSEVFFIEEFHSRFNFIAVDYLIYTSEVISNIWESYPIVWIMGAFLLGHFFLARFLFRSLRDVFPSSQSRLVSGVALTIAVLCYFWISEARLFSGVGLAEAEISKNPVHTIFAAYFNNEISFNRFYRTINAKEAVHIVHESLEENEPKLKGEGKEFESEFSIARDIVEPGPEKKLNVVVVLMESMSARFLKSFGSKKDITPNLDRLAQEGLSFDRIYSTGTRTVRGIEAVVLSIPPTPGQSIVRRPDNGSLFNIGSVFRDKGYQTQFLYGGNAYFDNMGSFFSANGFEVLDQASMNKSEVQFTNAWGSSDEDLFNFALARADKIGKKPFFQFILTASNHRPYTYPKGRIDLPPHSGRDGAVKYSDFSIGEYLEAARKKSWFDDTIFIFVADHNASVAGGTKIYPYDYHIPMIFYSPKHIKPKRVDILGSQIDLAPTLFGLLNFSYQSKFFGHNLLKAKQGRAFLATYQTVGLWRGDKMVLLSPNRKVDVIKLDGEVPTTQANEILKQQEQDLNRDSAEIQETISYYETASDWFSEKLLKEQPKHSSVGSRANLPMRSL